MFVRGRSQFCPLLIQLRQFFIDLSSMCEVVRQRSVHLLKRERGETDSDFLWRIAIPIGVHDRRKRDTRARDSKRPVFVSFYVLSHARSLASREGVGQGGFHTRARAGLSREVSGYFVLRDRPKTPTQRDQRRE